MPQGHLQAAWFISGQSDSQPAGPGDPAAQRAPGGGGRGGADAAALEPDARGGGAALQGAQEVAALHLPQRRLGGFWTRNTPQTRYMLGGVPPAHAIVAWQTCASPGPGSESSIVRQVYLENPKPEEGAEHDPAIMTSHIIRAPPVLCAQVGTADGASVHVGIC